MAKFRFRLLRGTHVDDTGEYDSKDPKHRVIETDVNLARKLGSDKFARLASRGDSAIAVADGPEDEEEEPEETDEPEEAEPEVSDELNDFTLAQLKEIAVENEIDLGAATRKKDIRKILRENGY